MNAAVIDETRTGQHKVNSVCYVQVEGDSTTWLAGSGRRCIWCRGRAGMVWRHGLSAMWAFRWSWKGTWTLHNAHNSIKIEVIGGIGDLNTKITVEKGARMTEIGWKIVSVCAHHTLNGKTYFSTGPSLNMKSTWALETAALGWNRQFDHDWGIFETVVHRFRSLNSHKLRPDGGARTLPRHAEHRLENV